MNTMKADDGDNIEAIRKYIGIKKKSSSCAYMRSNESSGFKNINVSNNAKNCGAKSI